MCLMWPDSVHPQKSPKERRVVRRGLRDLWQGNNCERRKFLMNESQGLKEDGFTAGSKEALEDFAVIVVSTFRQVERL